MSRAPIHLVTARWPHAEALLPHHPHIAHAPMRGRRCAHHALCALGGDGVRRSGQRASSRGMGRVPRHPLNPAVVRCGCHHRLGALPARLATNVAGGRYYAARRRRHRMAPPPPPSRVTPAAGAQNEGTRSTSRLVSLASSLDVSGSRRLPVRAASSAAPDTTSALPVSAECFGGGNSACCGNTAMGTVPTLKE